VTRIRSLLVCVLAVGVLGLFAAAAQACEANWKGGSGNWGTASAWSPEEVPNSGKSVCITAAGNYTVVIPANGGQAKTLTVGGASGVQTIDVVGESWNDRGDTNNEATLSAETMSFAANTKLILQTSGGGGSVPAGGGGVLQAYTVDEAGQIETGGSDASWPNKVRVSNLEIQPGASLLNASGTLIFLQEGEGAHPWATANEGTFSTAPGAVTEMQPSFSGKAGFINTGSVVNEGSITTHGAEWEQQSGSESGNPVVLQSGATGGSTLIDSAGPGSFLANNDEVTVTGTIPAGQTVTVRGASFNYQGENYYSTGLSDAGTELVNDGTLVLNPTGSGEASGGSVNIEAGSIHNNGLIVDETETASRVTQQLDSLTNGPTGRVEINGGIFQGNNGALFTNEGVVTIAPGAVYQLQEAGSFVNSGTFSPEIASASSFGAVQLTSPCCNGPGVFKAGGTLAPVLVGGYTPPTGQEFDVFALDGGKFEGTFASLANGFSGDYSHESSETAFVGVVYGGSTGGGGGGGGSVKPPPVAGVKSVSAKHGKITVKLSCPAGGAACTTDTLKATVVEHLSKHGRIVAVTAAHKKAGKKTVVVATATATLAAGATETITLKLNATGRALLARYGRLNVLVTVSSGGKALEKLAVHLTKPPKPKTKR
jgi:hypothetical protein